MLSYSIFEIHYRVKVAVRVRPFNQRLVSNELHVPVMTLIVHHLNKFCFDCSEKDRKASLVIEMQGATTLIKNPEAPG